MVVRRLQIALILICLGPGLASCSGFSGVVADHWPRWAGGMPDDVPPRPGAPGYEQYIAHQQNAEAARSGAAAASAPNQPLPAPGPPPPQAAPAAQAPPPVGAPPPAATAGDQSVVRGGGLY